MVGKNKGVKLGETKKKNLVKSAAAAGQAVSCALTRVEPEPRLRPRIRRDFKSSEITRDSNRFSYKDAAKAVCI